MNIKNQLLFNILINLTPMGRMYILYHLDLKLAELYSSLKADSQERRQLSSRPTKKEIKYIAFYLRNIDSHTCLLQASPATFLK